MDDVSGGGGSTKLSGSRPVRTRTVGTVIMNEKNVRVRALKSNPNRSLYQIG